MSRKSRLFFEQALAAHFKGTCLTVPRMVFLVFTTKCTKNQPEGKSMN